VPRKGGWTRKRSRGGFRYFDARGREITDETAIARIESLVIPPAWRDVWISSSSRAKLQATGIDRARRTQYLYHPEFRAAQEQEKFDKLVRFAERLPDLRKTMAKHMDRDDLDAERVCAIAIRLINLGWFRVGSERYAKTYRTYGITTLTKGHVTVRGSRISFRYRSKQRALVRTALVDEDLAEMVKELLNFPGGRRLFRYEFNGDIYNLSARRLNEYIRTYLGEEFTAKDFRTWGGTLIAAVALAEHGPPDTETEAKRAVASVMRMVGEKLGNTPAVARSSYVSPAVIEQYLDGRTLDDFRPRRLRVVRARETTLDHEEQALLSLLRSWRIRRAKQAA
jgi:DNA topoisomerase I